jgi:hypothetical protein
VNLTARERSLVADVLEHVADTVDGPTCSELGHCARRPPACVGVGRTGNVDDLRDLVWRLRYERSEAVPCA